MKLLIIGATGMIGSRITNEAVTRGHKVLAASRNPSQSDSRDGLETVTLDVTDAATLSVAAGNVDAVIAAVSPRNTDDAMAEALTYVDSLIAGVGKTRLLLVGGAGSLNLPDGTPVCDVAPEAYRAEAKAMRAAYERIVASSIDFTVLAPAALIQPGERTGTFRLGGNTLLTDGNGDSKISAEDYAVAMLNEAETPAHKRQLFTAAY